MEKPTLATNIDGLLLEHDVFSEPHRDWFKRAIEKTGDTSLERWVGKEDYFLGVKEAMKKIMPDTSDEKRTKKAREWYQEEVVNYIENHPEKIKENIKQKLEKLKYKYKIILLTSNTKSYIHKILSSAKLEGIYDGIVASITEKEPSKEELINELISKYGKPAFYITGKPEDKINKKFEELGIEIIGVEKVDKL